MQAWSTSWKLSGALDTSTALRAAGSPQTEEFVRRVQSVTWGRSFLVKLAFGFLGLGPATTNTKNSTDMIYILYGMSVPVILPPRHEEPFYNLIGEAYVHAIMNGEALAGNSPGTEEEFIIR